MWKPPMLLEPAVERILRDNFPPEYVEFLGWKNGRATALNNNWGRWGTPASLVKAANTLLAKPSAPALLRAMLAKKRASATPCAEPVVPPELEAIVEEHHEAKPRHNYDPEAEIAAEAGQEAEDAESHQLFADSREQAELDNE